MNNTLIATVIALLTFSFISCTKSNTDEPLSPSGKKIIKAFGYIEGGDTLRYANFYYDSYDRLVRFAMGAALSDYRSAYVFNRDVAGIVTDFHYKDSAFDSFRGLFLIRTENWKPFYDKSNQRYTHAIRTNEEYSKNYDNSWEQDLHYIYKVDSIAYVYTGDKITSVEYYSKSVYPDEEYPEEYKMEGHTNVIRDGKGRVTRLTETSVSEYRPDYVTEDLLTEYDDKMNPFDFGKEGYS